MGVPGARVTAGGADEEAVRDRERIPSAAEMTPTRAPVAERPPPTTLDGWETHTVLGSTS
jgi:hypothetical protein